LQPNEIEQVSAVISFDSDRVAMILPSAPSSSGSNPAIEFSKASGSPPNELTGIGRCAVMTRVQTSAAGLGKWIGHLLRSVTSRLSGKGRLTAQSGH
jgi:hypothetical protein